MQTDELLLHLIGILSVCSNVLFIGFILTLWLRYPLSLQAGSFLFPGPLFQRSSLIVEHYHICFGYTSIPPKLN